MKRNTQVDAEFFKQWSPNMAYILGVVCADGCLVEHGNGYHCLNITSKDLSWLQEMKHVLQAAQKISRKERGYQLQIRNQPLYRSLLNLGLTPRKSKTLQLPAVPSEVFPDFVRGYFDGDGCVRVWREKRWRCGWQLRTIFVSGSAVFVEELRRRLSAEAWLAGGSLWFDARAYYLQYTIGDSLRLADFMYHGGHSTLYLGRKRERFERFKHLRSCVDQVSIGLTRRTPVGSVSASL